MAANTAGELDRALADYTKVRHDLDSAERQVAALQFNLDNEVREHQVGWTTFDHQSRLHHAYDTHTHVRRTSQTIAREC